MDFYEKTPFPKDPFFWTRFLKKKWAQKRTTEINASRTSSRDYENSHIGHPWQVGLADVQKYVGVFFIV